MKKIFLLLHKYLGLITGIVVFIVSITGCVWVFQEEIKSLYQEEYKFEIENKSVITPSEAKQIALTVYPGKNVHGTLYKEGDAVEVIFYEVEPEFYRSVYLHPYSGEILAAEDHEAGFFMFILDGHMTLWLGEEIGSHVVNISVLIFLIILVSGLVLWWPKKKNKKKKFSFQWKDTTRWKRKNYDLHSITGFYILLFAFIAAFTGSIMAYDWLQEVIYKTAGGEKSPLFIIPENVSAAPDIKSQAIQPIDRIVTKLQFENPDAASIEVHYPYDETASIYVEVTYQEGVYYSSDYRFFDQYTMEEISTPGLYGKYKEAGFADKLIRMNYDIHVGAIGGLPGKILAFIISLITASLPVTGFLLWYGKRFKKKNKENVFVYVRNEKVKRSRELESVQ